MFIQHSYGQGTPLTQAVETNNLGIFQELPDPLIRKIIDEVEIGILTEVVLNTLRASYGRTEEDLKMTKIRTEKRFRNKFEKGISYSPSVTDPTQKSVKYR